MPHPATLFLLLTGGIIFLSWLCEVYGVHATWPQTGEEIWVQSLLSPEGVRWSLRNVISNFTGFAPLGMTIVALFGLGVAHQAGLIDACIRRGLNCRPKRRTILVGVISLGLLSNAVGDAGYIILLPIAAILFRAAGLHPMGGLITAYVSVACGYSANIALATLDPLLARTTQEASDFVALFQGSTGLLSNYYFLFISTIPMGCIIYWVTVRYLLPALGEYSGEESLPNLKPLSHKERRALATALFVAILYIALISALTFTSFGMLRGVSGGLIHSPFMASILFLLSLGIGLTGLAYGFSSGRFRTDGDIIQALVQPMRILAIYFVIAFFAAQLFACFAYSRLDQCLLIGGANLFAEIELGQLPTLILFILFTAVMNLLLVSAMGKWSFMAFIFVPLFARMGISPDVAQAAFRIGDSVTNPITPFLMYMPLMFAYMQQYDPKSSYGTLLKYTWRYSVYCLIGWILLFVCWYVTGLPFGF